MELVKTKIIKMEIYVEIFLVREDQNSPKRSALRKCRRASVITYRDQADQGFGFVTMNDDGEANKAIEAMNDMK